MKTSNRHPPAGEFGENVEVMRNLYRIKVIIEESQKAEQFLKAEAVTQKEYEIRDELRELVSFYVQAME